MPFEPDSKRHWTLPHGERHNQTMTKLPRLPLRRRILGGYLFALCAYQLLIYRWPGGPPFVLDPRAGIPVLLINHFSFTNKVIYPVEWATAGWLVFIAAMILFWGKFVKVYLIAEALLAVPTAYYIAVLISQRGGDFAPGFHDVILTFLLFFFFSAVPMALALYALFPAHRRESEPVASS
jgi:hypothetical protein